MSEIREGDAVMFRKPWLDRHTAAMAKQGCTTTLRDDMVGLVLSVSTREQRILARQRDRKRTPLTRTITTALILWPTGERETFTNRLPLSAVKTAR